MRCVHLRTGMKAEFIIPDDTKCRDALMEALRHASQTIDGGVLPVEAARKMASGLGDCYAFLQQDIAMRESTWFDSRPDR